ncbi:MAG: PTS sugar transporter subunit IIA [Kiritimatiellae bacterium]|nr:PTS sugar transporter subunit IIA [Kiritimatiellia bacterium]
MAEETKTLYLSSFFNESDIVIEQIVPSNFNLIHKLTSHLIERHLPGANVETIVDMVLRRERIAPTIVGDGVMLPHARIEGLERPYLALGIYPAGIPTSEGQPPVKLVFLLLVPEKEPARYLQILRAIANLLRDTCAVERLVALTTPEEVMQALRRKELKLPDYICAGDLMETKIETLHMGVPLSEAFEAFMMRGVQELPIIDEGHHLVGAIDTRALLGNFIPTGLRKLFPKIQGRLDDTMEALAERLRETATMRVCEAMEDRICTCQVDTPAREVAADLAENNATVCYVLDADRKLIGAIPVALFFRRILKD